MPRSKALRRERLTDAVMYSVDAAAPSGVEGNVVTPRISQSPETANVPAPINGQIITPSDTTIEEVNAAKMIGEFEEARRLALEKGQAAAAVAATMAKARLAGLLKERPESKPAPPPRFDGNYTEAARRIAFLLRLSADQMAGGQER